MSISYSNAQCLILFHVFVSGHRVFHTDERPYKCFICSKLFKRSKGLKRHIKTIHSSIKSRDFQCSICQKSFFTKGNLSVHALLHKPDGVRLTCYFCKRGISRKSNLERHIRTHTQEKPFVCLVDSCQFSTSYPTGLINHTKNLHRSVGALSRSIPLSCYFCSSTFNSSWNMQNHLRIHTLETPFLRFVPKTLQKPTDFKSSHFISHHGKTVQMRRMPKMFFS